MPEETRCRCLLPWEAGAVSKCTCTPAGGVRLSPGSHRSPSSLHGISFLDSKQVLHAPWGRGLGLLYTTVLRELRLWQPLPGSASVAGGVPLWAGSGGTSRALLLSAESSRSARETPEAGRGCSRHRGDAPSLSPSPGTGGLASAGSKASSSAGDRGVSAGWWVWHKGRG